MTYREKRLRSLADAISTNPFKGLPAMYALKYNQASVFKWLVCMPGGCK